MTLGDDQRQYHADRLPAFVFSYAISVAGVGDS